MSLSVPKKFDGAEFVMGKVVKQMVITYLYKSQRHFNLHHDVMREEGWNYVGGTRSEKGVEATWEKSEDGY